MTELKIIGMTIASMFGILAFGTIIAIAGDAIIQWHAPIWPFPKLDEFLKLIRGIFVVSFLIGFFGACCYSSEMKSGSKGS